MIKIVLGYFIFFCLLNLARASRVRLCVQTNNYEKMQPTCVLCPSRQQLAKTMELCTGSSEYQANITFQQAKCLISICNRNQLPGDLQANQLIESSTKNNHFVSKFARPGKQQLVHYSSQQSNAGEVNGNMNGNVNSNLNGNMNANMNSNMNGNMNGNNLNGLSGDQQSDADGESGGQTSPAGDLGEQQTDLSSSKPILPADSLVTSGAMGSTMNSLNALNGLPGTLNGNVLNGNALQGNALQGSNMPGITMSNNLNTVSNWPSTVMPSKLIFKRKPFKFRFWPFFG